MARIVEWDSSLETGHQVIDEHHKNLVAIINMLHGETLSGVNQSQLSYIFNELHAYTEYHFSEEEKIMRECSSNGSNKHIAEHKNFINILKNHSECFKSQEDIVGYSMI